MEALRTLLALSKSDTGGLVGKVSVPVLVVMSCRDPNFNDPAAEAARLAGRTKAQVALVTGAGYYAHVEISAQIAGEIERLLDRLKGK